MSNINEKIKILLKNKGWTQAFLAKKLSLSETAVQKWCTGKNCPQTKELLNIIEVFDVSYNELLDESIEIPEYIWLGRYLPYDRMGIGGKYQESEHDIFDAYLEGNAFLHRFTSPSGKECSAIYQYKKEIWWHYREHEGRMIKDWNEGYKND